jgi:hypothetical protein
MDGWMNGSIEFSSMCFPALLLNFEMQPAGQMTVG